MGIFPLGRNFALSPVFTLPVSRLRLPSGVGYTSLSSFRRIEAVPLRGTNIHGPKAGWEFSAGAHSMEFRRLRRLKFEFASPVDHTAAHRPDGHGRASSNLLGRCSLHEPSDLPVAKECAGHPWGDRAVLYDCASDD